MSSPDRSSASEDLSLREFELLVLLAVVQLEDNAYGVTVRRRIEERTGRRVARGAVYVTLERLVAKGYLTSEMSRPTPVRGGRAKRLFSVERLGLQALRQTLDGLERMRAGIPAGLLDTEGGR